MILMCGPLQETLLMYINAKNNNHENKNFINHFSCQPVVMRDGTTNSYPEGITKGLYNP